MEALEKGQKGVQKSFYFLSLWGNSRWQRGGIEKKFWPVFGEKYIFKKSPQRGVNQRRGTPTSVRKLSKLIYQLMIHLKRLVKQILKIEKSTRRKIRMGFFFSCILIIFRVTQSAQGVPPLALTASKDHQMVNNLALKSAQRDTPGDNLGWATG